jgi:hypothetical protein
MDPSRVIIVGITDENGMGLLAGNLGLSVYQIVIGFTEGNDEVRAHRLSDQVMQELSKRWQIEKLSTGQGAFPMKACGD